MIKENWKKELCIGMGLLGAFAVWTLLVLCVDVQVAGESQTKVGMAVCNVWLHRITGVHWRLYVITDWLGLVPVAICMCFGVLGLCQWIRRRHIWRVDADLLLLGGYYILVMAGYLVFEMIPINYRPVLINGIREASYPSSTTLLVLGVMPTLQFQIRRRCKNPILRTGTAVFAASFAVCMVVGRLVSGVHWGTDIIGSVWLSTGLFFLYRAAVHGEEEIREQQRTDTACLAGKRRKDTNGRQRREERHGIE